MGVCITCLNDAIVDINGQCFECYSERKTTDVWGQKIPHLMRSFKEE